MNTVAIIGAGLMGGSLGLALRRRGLATVHVYARREETRKLAIEQGVADHVFAAPQEAVRNAEIVVFCTPICTIPEIARSCATSFGPDCVITDVGSTKSSLVSAMDEVVRGKSYYFVGSHPMAGSERVGLEAARADLYQGAVVALTPSVDTSLDALERIRTLWRGVGARVVDMLPDQHDHIVAKNSHLPHLVAALLVLTAGRDAGIVQKLLVGQGFRDSTRIASGSPDIWHDIVKTNRDAILLELEELRSRLLTLTDAVRSSDYESVRVLLSAAQHMRANLIEK